MERRRWEGSEGGGGDLGATVSPAPGLLEPEKELRVAMPFQAS